MESLVVERPRPPNADIRGMDPVEFGVYPLQLRESCVLFIIIHHSMAELTRGSDSFRIVLCCKGRHGAESSSRSPHAIQREGLLNF